MSQDDLDSPQGELLLIHEDTDVRRALTSAFQAAGYKVNAVVRSSNAEKWISAGKTCAVLLALEGGGDCFPGLRELKERVSGAPFVVMMNEPSREDLRACFRLGVADVLEDPPRAAEAVSSMAAAREGEPGRNALVAAIPAQSVAIIHGDQAIRASYVLELSRLGHSAAGGEEPQDIRVGRGRKHPSILLFSAKCWRSGGPAYVRKLAAKGAHTRVIVVGSARTLRGEEELRESGVQALLVDPVPVLELDHQFEVLLSEPPAADGLGTEDLDTQHRGAGAEKNDGVRSSEKKESRGAGERSPMRAEVIELAETLRSGRARVSNISPVAMELQAMCAEGPSSMKELVEKIEQDPNLAAATLRASNSVAYRGMPRVIDLYAAGQRLGTRRLAEVSQTEAIKGVYKGAGKGWGRLLTRMWRHTVTTAHAARLLGERLDLPNQGAIYTMALLHNLGEVLIVDLYRKGGHEAPEGGIAAGALVHDMNLRHAALGALLLKSWDFPPALASIALTHHDPSDLAEGTPLSRHAWLIGALSASTMAGPTKYKETPDGGPPLPTAAAMLGIRVEDFERTVELAHKWWAAQGD